VYMNDGHVADPEVTAATNVRHNELSIYLHLPKEVKELLIASEAPHVCPKKRPKRRSDLIDQLCEQRAQGKGTDQSGNTHELHYS